MRRVVIGAAAIGLLTAVAATAFAEGVVPGFEGCVFRSVDEDTYVRRNESVLRALRLPAALRQAHVNTWSNSITATNPCLPFAGEDGPPYSNFITTYVMKRRAGGPPLGLDVRVLGPRWVRRPNSYESFCNGPASLHVSSSDEGLLLSADHRGCAGHR
jgi:hypothetical protein